MYKPRPARDGWETRLAEVHTVLQGAGATHLDTRYRIVDLPTLDAWTEDWGEDVECLLLRPRIELEQLEERGAEGLVQLDDTVQPNDGQPENEQPKGKGAMKDKGQPEVTGAQLPFPWGELVWMSVLNRRRHSL
jgi:hypothetical protein